jgi:ribosomal protein L24E
MSVFVLLMLFLGKGEQAVSWTAEFNSREACTTAAMEWEKSLKDDGKVIYMCSAKLK